MTSTPTPQNAVTVQVLQERCCPPLSRPNELLQTHEPPPCRLAVGSFLPATIIFSVCPRMPWSVWGRVLLSVFGHRIRNTRYREGPRENPGEYHSVYLQKESSKAARMTPHNWWSSTSGDEKTSLVSAQLPVKGSSGSYHLPGSRERATSACMCDAQLFRGVSVACLVCNR